METGLCWSQQPHHCSDGALESAHSKDAAKVETPLEPHWNPTGTLQEPHWNPTEPAQAGQQQTRPQTQLEALN